MSEKETNISAFDELPERRRMHPAEWQKDADIEDFVLPPLATELGGAAATGAAVSLGQISKQPEHQIPRLTAEMLERQFWDERVTTMAQIERQELVPVGAVEHRIFEPTDAPGFGEVKNRLAHILQEYPSALFVRMDDGFQAYVDPALIEFN